MLFKHLQPHLASTLELPWSSFSSSSVISILINPGDTSVFIAVHPSFSNIQLSWPSHVPKKSSFSWLLKHHSHFGYSFPGIFIFSYSAWSLGVEILHSWCFSSLHTLWMMITYISIDLNVILFSVFSTQECWYWLSSCSGVISTYLSPTLPCPKRNSGVYIPPF